MLSSGPFWEMSFKFIITTPKQSTMLYSNYNAPYIIIIIVIPTTTSQLSAWKSDPFE